MSLDFFYLRRELLHGQAFVLTLSRFNLHGAMSIARGWGRQAEARGDAVIFVAAKKS